MCLCVSGDAGGGRERERRGLLLSGEPVAAMRREAGLDGRGAAQRGLGSGHKTRVRSGGEMGMTALRPRLGRRWPRRI